MNEYLIRCYFHITHYEERNIHYSAEIYRRMLEKYSELRNKIVQKLPNFTNKKKQNTTWSKQIRGIEPNYTYALAANVEDNTGVENHLPMAGNIGNTEDV